MPDFIVEGGPFMLPLTVLALLSIAVALKKGIDFYVRDDPGSGNHRGSVNAILQIGIFCFFFGVLSQAVGLYQALGAIVAAGDVSPALIFGGLRVSFIAPIYGLVIFLFTLAAWSVLKYKVDEVSA